MKNEVNKPINVIEIVADGYENPIRELDQSFAETELIKIIPVLAREHGARQDIPMYTLVRAVEIILKKFSGLGLKEIEQAYLDFATNDISVVGGEAYGGEFNLIQISRILAAYSQQRGLLLQKLFNARENRLIAKQEESRRDLFKEEFKVTISEAKKTVKSWRDIPDWWYKVCSNQGLIVFESGESSKILEDAKLIAVDERKALIIEWQKKVSKKPLLAPVPSLEDLSKSIARRISVYRKVLGLN